jgi:hypothetical protein
MLSANAIQDDMHGVDSFNITSPASPCTRLRARLERRSQLIARELAAEDHVVVSPTRAITNDNDKETKWRKRAHPGSDSQRSGSGVPRQRCDGGRWRVGCCGGDGDSVRLSVDDTVKAARASRHHHRLACE